MSMTLTVSHISYHSDSIFPFSPLMGISSHLTNYVNSARSPHRIHVNSASFAWWVHAKKARDFWKEILRNSKVIKVCLNRYSWGAGKVGSEHSSWFIRLECICMQTRLKMKAGDWPTLNMNAIENYMLSHSLRPPPGIYVRI